MAAEGNDLVQVVALLAAGVVAVPIFKRLGPDSVELSFNRTPRMTRTHDIPTFRTTPRRSPLGIEGGRW
jgi:hypothetical protein